MELWISDTASLFWAAAGHGDRFPRDIERALVTLYPVAVIRLPGLFVSKVDQWLRAKGADLVLASKDRPLCGCIVAYGGKAVVFVDGTDPAQRIRYTIAHEAAHLFVDYWRPREQALAKIGDEVLQVIDGLRSARVTERVDSVLGGVKLGVYTHLMERGTDGQPDTHTADAESRADRLAAEFLAPADRVYRRIPRATLKKPYASIVRSVTRSLVSYFGLPKEIACPYAAHLCRARFGGPSFREWLGIAKSPSDV